MARAFSSDDVSRLISLYQSLSRSSKESAEKLSALRKRLDAEAQAVLNSKIVNSSIQDQLATGNFNVNPHPNEMSLAHAALHYSGFSELDDRLNSVCRKYESDNARLLASLAVAASPIRWFFSGRRIKERASSAFSDLQQRAAGEYGQAIAECHNAFSVKFDILPNAAHAQIPQKKEEMLAAIHKCCPASLNRINSEEFEEKLHRYQAAYDLFQQSLSSREKEKRLQAKKDEVLRAVERASAEQAMKELDGYDVDTLNQVRTGIRVKALRDAGYDTVGKIYTAQMFSISTVYGISMESARIIKQAAGEIAQTVRQSVKLRLSSDDRTPSKSNLLASLLAYAQTRQIIERYESAISLLFKTITVKPETALAFRNNIDWIFFSTEEKASVRTAYTRVNQLLDQNIEELVRYYKKAVTQNIPPNIDMAWDDFSKDPYKYYNLLEELVPGVLGNGDVLYGLPEDLAREIQEQAFFPDGLKVTLRRYQEWGVKYILHQKNALLGDEMGLGKTVQAIATMVSLRNTGAKYFMVVCPASVLPNWCKEISTKSLLNAIRIHGSSRDYAVSEWSKKGGAAVTTFETLNSVTLPKGFQFDLLVVDEAHFIKNENALRSQNVRRIGTQARRMLFMTGTALENKVEEMLSLIQVLQPPVAEKAKNIAFMSTAPQFREAVAPVYYRRKREDVLTELPDITEVKEWCDLSPVERDIYRRAVRAKDRTAIRRVSWNASDMNQSAKAQRMLEIIQEAKEDGRRVLVFSFYLETIQRVIELLGSRCTQPINGSVSVERRQEIIDRFEKMPAGSVLPAQIQAGGTGLNIQSASVVIICEPQLKPSIENQAISRSYRMGQTRKVLVYRLLAVNTIDEKIDEMLTRKQSVFNAFADVSAAAAASRQEEQQIDDKTFGKLIQEEIDRINAESGYDPQKEQKAAAEPVQHRPSASVSTETKPEIRQQNARQSSASQPSRKPFPWIPLHNYSQLQRSNAPSPNRTPEKSVRFNSVEDMVIYIQGLGITVKDNRHKNGSLWIKADPRINNMLRDTKFVNADDIESGFHYAKTCKAFNGADGWYY